MNSEHPAIIVDDTSILIESNQAYATTLCINHNNIMHVL